MLDSRGGAQPLQVRLDSPLPVVPRCQPIGRTDAASRRAAEEPTGRTGPNEGQALGGEVQSRPPGHRREITVPP